jgi:hypothetical protein
MLLLISNVYNIYQKPEVNTRLSNAMNAIAEEGTRIRLSCQA